MWISPALSGFAMGTTFGSGAVWMSQYIEIKGLVAPLFHIGVSTGGMVGGMLAGYLFEYYSHMWVIYLPLIACVCHMALCFVLYAFIKISLKQLRKSEQFILTCDLQCIIDIF